MRFKTILFNIILLIGLATGCQTEGDKKEFTSIQFYMETSPGSGWNTMTVPIYREQPIPVEVEKTPFLDDGDVARAELVDDANGFYLQIVFNRRGTLLLETMTRSQPGKRIAIRCHFPETRWLAAPQIKRPISNGILAFTPDASREEAERIVRGLNNLIAKVKKEEHF
jgi:hypothetical protein